MFFFYKVPCQVCIKYLHIYIIFLSCQVFIIYTYVVTYCQVGDAEKCTDVSNILMSQYGIYVQAINYPTVARGTERLRLAPTAHHSRQMMDFFVQSIVSAWRAKGLPLFTTTHPKACESCKKDLSLPRLYGAEPICSRSNCTYQSMQAALA